MEVAYMILKLIFMAVMRIFLAASLLDKPISLVFKKCLLKSVPFAESDDYFGCNDLNDCNDNMTSFL